MEIHEKKNFDNTGLGKNILHKHKIYHTVVEPCRCTVMSDHRKTEKKTEIH